MQISHIEGLYLWGVLYLKHLSHLVQFDMNTILARIYSPKQFLDAYVYHVMIYKHMGFR